MGERKHRIGGGSDKFGWYSACGLFSGAKTEFRSEVDDVTCLRCKRSLLASLRFSPRTTVLTMGEGTPTGEDSDPCDGPPDGLCFGSGLCTAPTPEVPRG